MSNSVSSLSSCVLAECALDKLQSATLIVAHEPFKKALGAGYDLRMRSLVRARALADFSTLRECMSSDVAYILWCPEEDRSLVALLAFLNEYGVSYPVLKEWSKQLAVNGGNPHLCMLHEHTIRALASITPVQTIGASDAGPV